MKKISLTCGFVALILSSFGAVQISAQAKNLWSGEWKVPSRFAPATLTIKEVTARTFKFRIEAARGARTKEIEGTAAIRGSKAHFVERERQTPGAKANGCRLTFTNNGASISVEMTDECVDYPGDNVFFAEVYYKGDPAVREKDFVVLEVFPDARLDAGFKALVGDDYENFLDSFHMIDEGADLDDLGAQVFAGCVWGICPTNAGIIMYDAQGNYWAAVLELRENENEVIANYYTNASDWAEKMPQTLEKWIAEKRAANNKLSVRYRNKK